MSSAESSWSPGEIPNELITALEEVMPIPEKLLQLFLKTENTIASQVRKCGFLMLVFVMCLLYSLE